MGVGMIENNCSCYVVDSNNYISIAVFNYDANIMKKSNNNNNNDNDNDNGSQIDIHNNAAIAKNDGNDNVDDK